MELTDSVESLPGVGPALSKKLAQAGIETIYDCINYLPRRYEDYSHVTAVKDLKPGHITVKVNITNIHGRYVRRGMHITEAIAKDDTGSVRVVWFNQPYRSQAIKTDETYYVSGEFKLSRQRFAILNPAMEMASNFPVHTARIVPVYKESYGLKSLQIRKIISACLPVIKKLPDTLPKWLIKKQDLIPYSEALTALHFPNSTEELEQARERYGFEEVFELTLAALLNKQAFQSDKGMPIPMDVELAQSFVKKLPFDLTDSQRQAVWHIYQDMARHEPMNRLLEGDVGSGKTVVAIMSAIMAIRQGFQVAFMAPTELLARQHAETIEALLTPLGMEKQMTLLIGSLKQKQKSVAHTAIASGKAQLIVGTHALIADKVSMNRLGLVIVDEQHRFGVEQRKLLQKKAGHMPHVLHMTATPIPRSLALTLYGELDISLLKQKPRDRKSIETEIVASNGRQQMYREVQKQLKQGRQVYVVCPLIEPSDSLKAVSATEMYDRLSKGEFHDWRVGLLHGKLPAEEKERVMQAFMEHKIDVLVATTVIEVGVDVANASVMIIESADRFGLAQAHQLRGRVGRSDQQSYCYLVLSEKSSATRRMRALASSNDGFRLAELDLEIRGPGSIYGIFQHGALDLRVASLTDTEMIAAARSAAKEFIDSGEDLLQYEHLKRRVDHLRSVTNLQ